MRQENVSEMSKCGIDKAEALGAPSFISATPPHSDVLTVIAQRKSALLEKRSILNSVQLERFNSVNIIKSHIHKKS